MRLADASKLHDVASRWSADRVLVEHERVEEYSTRVGRFLAALGDTREEMFWAAAARSLRRLRWDLATIPLPVNHPAVGVAHTAELALARLDRCADVAPHLAPEAAALASALRDLADCLDDPLGDAVRDVLPDSGDQAWDEVAEAWRPVGVLVRDGRNVATVAGAFDGRATVVAQAQLPSMQPFAQLAVVGPVAWFSPAILRAPRSPHLSFLYFGWLRDEEPQLDLLVGAATEPHAGLKRAPGRSARPFSPDAPTEEPANEWIPRADWAAIGAQGRRQGEEQYAEPVSAWLFAVASGEGVYLEAADTSRAVVAELEEELVVHQLPVSDIVSGTYLVLRTEGEGDYVRAMADSLLGGRARNLRELQRWWKRQLSERLSADGVDRVVRELVNAGAPRARENLRRWASPESILTRNPADFRAILTIIGAPERFDEIWPAMHEILDAHIRAGARVRQLLLDELCSSDTTLLRQQGWADYDVKEIEGEGTLRVARVEARAPETHDVPRIRLRRPFKIARDLWLG